MSLADFDIQQKLGEGSYSIVYKAKRLTDGITYALKIVKIKSLKDKEKLNALNEVRILASVHHENIISYKQAFFDEISNSLCIVMEFADSGDMYQRICAFKQKGHYMSEKFIWRVFVQVVAGLKALHDMNILHRDLKSANVFVYRSGLAKLGDMNVSKVAKEGMHYTQTGTPYYASPEVWRDEPYDFKSDIWSLGCVIYEMAALRPPFQAEDMQGLYRKVTSGKFHRLPRMYSSELNSVIVMLLQVNPRDRPDCAELLSLPVVKEHVGSRISKVPTAEQSLLSTIYLPKNLQFLTERLPDPNYTDRSEKILSNRAAPNTIKSTREITSRSVMKSRPSLTPTMPSKSREYSESPGTSTKKVLRDNYGAFKLPSMKYPSSQVHRSSLVDRELYKRKASRLEDLIKRNRPGRVSVFMRDES